MSEPQRTEAAVRRSRWPGWIWAVPVAAIGIVGWLALREFISSGPEITVTFASAGGIQAGDTKVRYKDVQVGEVKDLKLSEDRSHVVVTIRMNGGFDDALNDGTRFWIVGARLDPADLSSLKTIISGSYIAMDPGHGKPARHFAGLEQPPPVRAAEAGTRFVLHANQLGAIRAGTQVEYLGLAVGKVESASLKAGGFEIRIFVDAPYDKLVHRGTRFWDAGAMSLALGGQGVRAELASLSTLVSGAIAFATTPEAARGPLASADARFPLYPDQAKADDAPRGPQLAYRLRFEGAVGDLARGAAVKLRGFRIGEVTEVGLAFDARRGELETPVTVEIEPERLKLEGVTPPADGNWRPAMDAALDKLVREGLRARLDQSPPVVGGRIVTLDFAKGDQPAGLVRNGDIPEIPTEASGDLAGLAAQASGIMRKIDALPLAEIGDAVRQSAEHVRDLVASPELARSLKSLDRSLANLDRVTREARLQAGPLIASLRKASEAAQQTVRSANAMLGGNGGEQDKDLPQAIYELAKAARAVRALADYLDRHPEALLAGRSGKAP